MNLYDTVDVLNSIFKTEGRLMLNRNMTIHEKFPAYKLFNYIIYEVRNSNDRMELLAHTVNMNTSGLDLTKCWEEADRNFMKVFLRWVMDKGHDYVDE